MKILGIETATNLCSVGLADGEDLVAEYRLNRKYSHAERLPEALDRMVSDTGFTLLDIDGLAVSIGPGSFTGLRIGLGIAKGLALGLKKPLAAVPTMDGLMFAVPPVCPLACVLLIARKGEVYRSLYRREESSWSVEKPVDVVLETAIDKDLPREPILFIGEGAIAYRDRIEECIHKPVLVSSYFSAPSGYHIASRGIELLKNGDEADLDTLTPTYIKRFQGIE